jgi:hypothetical protein
MVRTDHQTNGEAATSLKHLLPLASQLGEAT